MESMKDLLRISIPNILLVQEKKIEDVEFLQASNIFWKTSEGLAVSTGGASGGVGFLWKYSSFELVHSQVSLHWIFSILRHKDSCLLVSILNIYILGLYSEKKNIVGKAFRIYYPRFSLKILSWSVILI